MSFTPEGRHARARKAAIRRWRPDADTDQLDADLEEARLNQRIDELVELGTRVHEWSPEKQAELRRLFNSPAERGASG